jgi:integrator complex subunit 7
MNGSVRQAANLALLEVDRGLLSGNIGDQCEAIMQFPCLIDQFPLPVLISAAFLKLTDKFVSSHQNTIRQCISQVMVLCSKHLHKVTNIDDIFQKICTVFHSNDPVARGLTLSVFGAMSPLIADKKIVLQSVLKGLDSNHQYEQNAAIEAAHELCQYSR